MPHDERMQATQVDFLFAQHIEHVVARSAGAAVIRSCASTSGNSGNASGSLRSLRPRKST
jgi:hypothetical protein